MRLLVTLFTVLIFLTACGADPLNKGVASASPSSQSALGTQCSCAASYSPVCSSYGKTYDNICIAKCMGSTQSTQGHCQCQPTLIVCGNDGYNYNECDAIQFRIPITKFVACNKTAL